MQTVELTAGVPSVTDFEKYGVLMDIENQAPLAESEVFSFWNDIGVGDIPGPVSFGMVRTNTTNLAIPALERHLHTTETLVPLDTDIILVVAPPSRGDLPDLDAVRAFRIAKGRGVTLKKGTWHYVPLAGEQKPCRTLVVFQQGTPQNDLEIKQLPDEKDMMFRIGL